MSLMQMVMLKTLGTVVKREPISGEWQQTLSSTTRSCHFGLVLSFFYSGVNEGNCHSHHDCYGDLECGTNNCQWGPKWNGDVFTHNCCFDPNPTQCSMSSDCAFLGDSFRCGFQNCGSDNCCFDMQDLRCNEELFETYDANGDAKNSQECCSPENPCGAGEGGKIGYLVTTHDLAADC